jgi:integrase
MPLTDTAIRNAKAGKKPVKLFDGGGLFLLVTPTGGKWWRLKYRFGGKEKLLSLGTYPDVPLAGRKDKAGTWIDGARERRDRARTLLANGVDPGAARKAEKAAVGAAAASSFEAVAREWHTRRAGAWASATADTKLARLEADVFPEIGQRPIAELLAPELLKVLRKIEKRGAHEVTRRVRQIMGQVFRYAIATGRAERDPAADLRDALEATKPVHRAALTDKKAVGALLRAVAGYEGEPVTRAALALAPLVFVRPGELRSAEWTEIDLDDSTWRIAAQRMKMKDAHIVPLSRQAVAILRELRELTGHTTLVFPSIRSRARPMSENTLNAALRRLGYTKDEMTAHGFRTVASTLLHELGWPRDVIERQLAHAERNAVRAAYNRAEHLPERRKMMQAWADYLDGLATGADVVPMKRKR